MIRGKDPKCLVFVIDDDADRRVAGSARPSLERDVGDQVTRFRYGLYRPLNFS